MDLHGKVVLLMKIIDYFKIVFHSLVQNKLRTLLTIIVISLMSFSLMFLTYTMYYYNNFIDNTILKLNKDNCIYEVSFDPLCAPTRNFYDEYSKLLGESNEFTAYRTSIGEAISFNKYSNCSAEFYHVIEGEEPQNFSGMNVIYLPIESKEKYSIDSNYKIRDYEFVVKGYTNGARYFDIDYAVDEINPKIFTATTSFESKNLKDIKNSIKISSKRTAWVEANYNINVFSINTTFEKAVELFKNKNIITLISTISIILFAIILTSCISNSISILTDKNKDIYCLMKLIGSKNKNIIIINYIENFIVIINGVIVSFIFALLFNSFTQKIAYSLYEATLASIDLDMENIIIISKNYYFIPLFVLLLILIIASVFVIRTCKKYIKTEPYELVNDL